MLESIISGKHMAGHEEAHKAAVKKYSEPGGKVRKESYVEQVLGRGSGTTAHAVMYMLTSDTQAAATLQGCSRVQPA